MLPSQMVSWGYLQVLLWRWTSQIPLKGSCCIPLLAWPNPICFPPADSLHNHVESSFPYQTDTGLPHALLPATRRREWGAESSCSLFCFAKCCHGHRLTPKTRWQQPKEKAFQNASTRLLERWREPLLELWAMRFCATFVSKGLIPTKCALKQAKIFTAWKKQANGLCLQFRAAYIQQLLFQWFVQLA